VRSDYANFSLDCSLLLHNPNHKYGSQVKRIAKNMEQNGYQEKPANVSVNSATGWLEIENGYNRTSAIIKAFIDKIPIRPNELAL
jgi:hypothetical protein